MLCSLKSARKLVNKLNLKCFNYHVQNIIYTKYFKKAFFPKKGDFLEKN